MPFTLSHAAAILPFWNKARFSASGLIAGCFIPDFEYFFRLRVYGIYGHTLSGIFWFDLPLALVLIFFYHQFARGPLLTNLPKFFRERWKGYDDFNWLIYFRRNWLVVVVSILFGAFTHVLWDAFTHNSTFITDNLDFLNTQIDLGFESYPLWHLLQQTSTVLGLLIVLMFIFRMPAKYEGGTVSPLYWLLIGLLMAVIMSFGLTGMTEKIKIGHVAVIFMGAATYALIVTTIVWKLFPKIEQR